MPTGALPARSLVSPAAESRFSPGTNVTFDWSDVPGGSSYTIQMDDNNCFPAPFVVKQSVTTSQFTTSSRTACVY